MLTRKRIDATQGPILSQMLLYSFPLLLSTLVQQLFNSVDIAVLGNFADTTAVAAIGATGRDVFFAVESDGTVATVTGFDFNFYMVDECRHRNTSVGEKWEGQSPHNFFYSLTQRKMLRALGVQYFCSFFAAKQEVAPSHSAPRCGAPFRLRRKKKPYESPFCLIIILIGVPSKPNVSRRQFSIYL